MKRFLQIWVVCIILIYTIIATIIEFLAKIVGFVLLIFVILPIVAIILPWTKDSFLWDNNILKKWYKYCTAYKKYIITEKIINKFN